MARIRDLRAIKGPRRHSLGGWTGCESADRGDKNIAQGRRDEGRKLRGVDRGRGEGGGARLWLYMARISRNSSRSEAEREAEAEGRGRGQKEEEKAKKHVL